MLHFFKILFGYCALYMADETPAVVVSTGDAAPEETAMEAAALATAQAETIVETAQDLAEQIVRPNAHHQELLAEIMAVNAQIIAHREECAARHEEILNRLVQMETTSVITAAEVAAVVEEPTPPVETVVEETPVIPKEEVPEEEAPKPRQKKRRFI